MGPKLKPVFRKGLVVRILGPLGLTGRVVSWRLSGPWDSPKTRWLYSVKVDGEIHKSIRVREEFFENELQVIGAPRAPGRRRIDVITNRALDLVMEIASADPRTAAAYIPRAIELVSQYREAAMRAA